MSFTPHQVLVPDRDSLPLKKRDQRLSSVSQPQPQPQPQQCDAATFKAPYPYKSPSEFKTKHTGPFQPVPRRVPAPYQPWMQMHPSARPRPHVQSAFREHHGWPEWREFNPLHAGWDFPHHYQHHGHLSGSAAVHPGHPHPPSRFSPISLVSEGFRMGEACDWEQLKTLRDRSFHADRQSNGRNKGPYARRRDRRDEYFPRVEKASPASLSIYLPHPPPEDRRDLLHKSANVIQRPVSEHSFRRVSPGDNSNSACTSMKEGSPGIPSLEQPPPNRFPWLLPHFVAGSLIELRDGRLRPVEHLQTEDFLLGSLACPDLHLSCCTVQSIFPSASSASTSRLLILLHEQQSQELVDVYVEYPFFVRGQGWSSCNPPRTAHLCGLQCRQLSVGDVCLALTPVSAPRPPPPPPVAQEPKTPRRKSEMGCVPLKTSHPRVVPGPRWPAVGKKEEAEAARRRHCSAPELRGPGTNCMY
uniref:AXH domain-containing protein n=1 Tax=Scophthalmus maximus TaxID=52904 RepID=A0A8D3BMN7_SCOMX